MIAKHDGTWRVCAGALGMLGALGCRGPIGEKVEKAQEAPAGRQAALVRVVPAERMTLVDRCILPCRVTAWERVVLSSEVSGRVEARTVDVGDTVEEGALVTRVDSESLKADYDAVKARHDEAQSALQRLEKLFSLKNVSEDDIDKARSMVRVTEAQLRAAQLQVEKSALHTPLSGKINQTFVEEGEFVNKGQPVVEVVILDPLKAWVDVPEKDIAHIRPATPVRLNIGCLGLRAVPARVYRIPLTGDERTNTFAVELEILEEKALIKPGMIGRATFSKRTLENVIALPLFAVVPRGEEHWIFLAGDGKAEARRVRLGVVDGDRVEILDGLVGGEPVIVEGGRDLDDGAEIRVASVEG